MIFYKQFIIYLDSIALMCKKPFQPADRVICLALEMISASHCGRESISLIPSAVLITIILVASAPASMAVGAITDAPDIITNDLLSI